MIVRRELDQWWSVISATARDAGVSVTLDEVNDDSGVVRVGIKGDAGAGTRDLGKKIEETIISHVGGVANCVVTITP